MPTYDYQCAACGARTEIFHSIADAPRRKCPKCGKLKLVRQIGAGAGILFKGQGFYQTDYRSDSYKKGAEAEAPKKEAPKQETGQSETKSDGGATSDSPPKTPDSKKSKD